MTEDEYLANMTDELPSYEFVNGEVSRKRSLTKKSHVSVTKVLVRIFDRYERQTGGYYATEATTNLSSGADRRFRVPDLSYWAPGTPVGDDIFLPPTLAVEIRSPDQSLRVLREKCQEFLAHGVEVCWLVDPETRTVEVFEGEVSGIQRDGTLESGHLPGLSIPLKELFASLD